MIYDDIRGGRFKWKVFLKVVLGRIGHGVESKLRVNCGHRFESKIKNKIRITVIIMGLLFVYTFLCAMNYASAVSYDISDKLFRLHVIANSDSDEDQALKYKVRDALLNYMNALVDEQAKKSEIPNNITSNENENFAGLTLNNENKNNEIVNSTNNDVNLENISKDEVIEIARAHSDEFREIALQTIKENGYDYDVNIEIGNFEFPTKTYGDISLPSGSYDALRVKIGEASGQNWWCVMFPPLCFIDFSTGVVPEESKEYMKENMSEEEYALITSGNSDGSSVLDSSVSSNSRTNEVEAFNASDEAMSFKFKILELFHF